MKQCKSCLIEYPATKEFFYTNGKWLRNLCRKCQNKVGVVYVTNWRRNAKQKIVDLLGGICNRCGYKKCLGALDLHHKSDKNFTISTMLARHMQWKKIKKEIQKCELLCKNCHSELHYGFGGVV